MLIYCRAPLPPDSCLFDKYCGKKASDYDVPHATSVSDDQVYPCWAFQVREMECPSS